MVIDLLTVCSCGFAWVHVCVLISYTDTSHVGLGPIHRTSFSLIISLKAYLQIQSHSEILGIQTETHILGDTIQHITYTYQLGDLK